MAPAVPELRTQLGNVKVSELHRSRAENFLGKLPPAARAEELEQLRPAFSGSNSPRALATLGDFAQIVDRNPAAGDLAVAKSVASKLIRRALVLGVGRSVGDTSIGWIGVLGRRQAANALRAWLGMTAKERAKLIHLLKQAGEGTDPARDADTERALILKALAARLNRFAPTGISKINTMAQTNSLEARTAGMAALSEFADEIRGIARPRLMEMTNLVDLLEGKNTLWQRFYNTCGPNTAQMTVGYLDPKWAFERHRDGDVNHFSHPPGDFFADEQLRLLENSRPEKMKGQLRIDDTFWWVGERGGLLDGTDIFDRSDAHYLSKWMGSFASLGFIKRFVQTGSEEIAFERMEKELEDGKPVPLIVERPSGDWHYVLAIDVRPGTEGGRLFLIADGWSGTTTWKSEDQLRRPLMRLYVGEDRHDYNQPREPTVGRPRKVN